MMNPVSKARNLTIMSSTALGKHIGVSVQYISRLEQGLYDKPNHEVIKWATEVINRSADVPVKESDILAQYRQWQWERRKEAKSRLSLLPCSLTEYDLVGQPEIIYYHKIFKQWREDYWHSSHGFAVDMCLHPSPISDYEMGNTRKMPTNLKEVMLKLGLIGKGFKTNER